nr:immunoglobulin light chain junction region [Mus musculus]NSL99089.1 immunoglobulin light chain junction region [Mus musculus]NSM01404.1 immunoglobulin light chain junction region [Mus musculus]
CLQYDNLLTF